MSDKLILENYLLLLKSTIEVYIHGTLESSNNDIQKLLLNCLANTIESQRNTYLKMVEHNIYKYKNINSSIINKSYQELTK